MKDKSEEEYIVYSYYDLPVLTKEIATAEELYDEFGCIPDGRVPERSRIMKCIKLTRLNRKKLLEEEKDIPISSILPDIDKKMMKKMRYEWVERSW